VRSRAAQVAGSLVVGLESDIVRIGQDGQKEKDYGDQSDPPRTDAIMQSHFASPPWPIACTRPWPMVNTMPPAMAGDEPPAG